MRRLLFGAAVGLALMGLELAAGTVSMTAERLMSGTAAVLRGEDFALAAPRMAAGWILLTAALAMGGTAAWAGRAARGVRFDGAGCPRCGSDTRRIKRRRRHRLLEQLIEQGLTRRSCARCGWTGLSART